MLLHKFIKNVGYAAALTNERDGSNLPGGSAAWTFEESINVQEEDAPRIGASSEDILKAIEEQGYFKAPDKGEK